MRYYSYETYSPGDPGDRVSVEDWFESIREAQSAMATSLACLPLGSTGWVYRRYADGDIACGGRHFVKTKDGIAKAEGRGE